MFSLTLSAEELELLRTLLQETLSDLRMEIADTDNSQYRTRLHQREDMINQLIARLADQAADQADAKI